jgi:hypothetical protein
MYLGQTPVDTVRERYMASSKINADLLAFLKS